MPIPLFIGWPEAIIILIVVLVLFGGSRLAGVGKGVGRSIREFKEEVTTDDDQKSVDAPKYTPTHTDAQTVDEPVERPEQ
ncbi:twin-arginine translocase TatA/TatE family subunit [uncultured Tessaracoccus sp.]|uniref:twin-arginine translocase TatA/TatE family subunit n=1 Tax=uncultured Tessaracoccus sp. TaxID=905023 RepID=UPI0026162E06|nr:twin-arginine translocase TatA/TatE family subunit [uncultured Tessaracoccus sp.]